MLQTLKNPIDFADNQAFVNVSNNTIHDCFGYDCLMVIALNTNLEKINMKNAHF